MSDWQVGDLAVYVGGDSCGGSHEGARRQVPGLSKGAAKRVIGIRRGPFRVCHAPIALILENHNCGGRGVCPSRWRKVVPDERESCEPEFVTLLKRVKVPAQGTEARRAETTGSVHDGPVPQGCAQTQSNISREWRK